MQIWLFNQLVEEIQSALARTHSQGGMQGPFSANHIKRHPSFIHVQDCLGLLLIYKVVPIDPPPPSLPFGRLCAASVPQSRVEAPDGEALSGLGCVAYSAINPAL